MAGKTLHILIVEDSEDDARLLVREIKRGGYTPEFERVETADAMKTALANKQWDIIISDYTLPRFNALSALSVLKESGLDIPFLLVSGVIGEEKAVKAMKAGVHDYIMKGNYARLGPAIERELREVTIRRERRQAMEDLRHAHDELEIRVRQRTAELAHANEMLQSEIVERKALEKELIRANEMLEQCVSERTGQLELQQQELAARNRQLEETRRDLEVSRDRYLDLYDFAPLGYITLDDKGIIGAINLTGANLLGVPRETLIGTPFTSYMHKGDSSNLFRHLRQCRKSGQQIVADMGVVINGGSVIQAQLSTLPYQGEDGMTLFRTAITDVTALKEAEAALHRETTERLRTMEELRDKDRIFLQQSRQAAMGEMIGNIAHQWRQPLNALGLTIQDIGLAYEMGEFTTEQLNASIAGAMDIIYHMSRTIDDFRNFYKPDMEKRWFRVDQVLTRAISLVEENFREHRITIDVSADEELEISGYHNEYAQVLLNILMNARDVLLERGTNEPQVALRAWQEQRKSVVTICDNAGGICEEIMDKIFDPYFTTKESGLGTGIGLFISKSIIENKMGGRLTARNAGPGAEFRIEV
ncbi:MAG TPA: ATP-binding protein [Geobacteraceae bacterium]|nr:ATP-binding protein [Geobacteraceae bacterium]